MAHRIQWSPELVERFWTGIAQTRLSELNFSRHNAEHLIEVVAPYLKPQGRHLDYGAGGGDLVRALIQRGYPTAAYEPVQARAFRMVEGMTSHAGYLGAIGDDDAVPFDVVFMVEVVEHILEADLSGVFTRVKSLLAKNGRVIVTVPFLEDLELAQALCPQCESLFHRWQHQRAFDSDSLQTFMHRFGFECVALRREDFSCNRLMVEDLQYLHGELEKVRIRRERSWLMRLKRRVFRTKLEPPIPLCSSLAGAPTHLLYIGRPI
nr:class I SAM-dependent methyltransferase [Nitrospirota bacterium]